MADDANEVLKDIALMSGLQVEGAQEETQTLEATTDEQREEVQGEEEQASEEREGLQVEETEETEETEDDSVETRYARLLEAHNAMAAQMLELQARGFPVGSPQPMATVETPPPGQVTPPPPAQAPLTFALDEALLEKALIEDDPAAMKQVISGLVQHIEGLVSSTRAQTREEVLRDLPNVATQVARHQMILMKAVEQFYLDNQDLAPFQHIVGAVGQEISMKEPNLTINEALEKTGVEVRRRLGLRKQALKVEADRKPAFPKGGTGSRKPGGVKLTGPRADIAAMQNAKW